MSQLNNPFCNIETNKEKNNAITKGIDTEITELECRILRIKEEINNIEGLVEINTYYSDKKTDSFLWID
jgi:hypothetical protein